MNRFKVLIFFIVLLLWCCALVYHVKPDYDLFARLIAGMSVVENGKVLMHDFYSYTQTNPVWLDHEYGASVVIYWVTTLSEFFHKTKFEMLVILQQLLIFAIMSLCVLCVKIRKPQFSVPYQILYFALAALAAKIAFVPTIRCHLFTFLFFALLLVILEGYRNYNKKYLLCFVPVLMLVWANTHGGCLSGLGILALYALGEALNKKDFKPYLITLFVSFAMLFINPYGIDYVKFLFTAGTMDRTLIQEWQSPFVIHGQAVNFIVYFAFMFGIFFGQLLSQKADFKNYDKTKLFLMLSTGFLSVLYAKLIPFFVITSSIFMFDDIFEILNKNKVLKWLNNPENKIVYAVIILLSAVVINVGNGAKKISLIQYPYQAVEFIKQKKLSGNLFTDMTYGSFCAYKLYPQNKIFMDGRYEEVYNPELLEKIKNFAKQEGENPMSVVTDYPTDIVLLFSNNKSVPMTDIPLSVKLQELGWKLIFKDGWWFVLVRPDYPYNDEIYDEFAKDKKESFHLDKYEYLSSKLFETGITKEILKEVSSAE
ncbi:MAG: hypothetical protein K6C94_00070 [Candidatus Gastranaerophilales bacterium]|nr:hypothetical protein [Candidatus Gastranaerophilales bacterium]